MSYSTLQRFPSKNVQKRLFPSKNIPIRPNPSTASWRCRTFASAKGMLVCILADGTKILSDEKKILSDEKKFLTS